MRSLIAEDDFVSRNIMQHYLSGFGQVDVAVDGEEAVDAVRQAVLSGEPYDLICLDIMMPRLSGQDALKRIREIEDQANLQADKRAKIIMTTALSDKSNIMQSFREQSDAYLVKPVKKKMLVAELEKLGLMEKTD